MELETPCYSTSSEAQKEIDRLFDTSVSQDQENPTNQIKKRPAFSLPSEFQKEIDRSLDTSLSQNKENLSKQIKKRPSISPSEKLFAVKRVSAGESKAKVAADIGIYRSNLVRWCKQTEALEAVQKAGRKRIAGAGKKPLSPELEEQLVGWLKERIRSNLRTSLLQLRAKGREIGAELGLEGFTASHGWADSFKRRNAVSFTCGDGEASAF